MPCCDPKDHMLNKRNKHDTPVSLQLRYKPHAHAHSWSCVYYDAHTSLHSNLRSLNHDSAHTTNTMEVTSNRTQALPLFWQLYQKLLQHIALLFVKVKKGCKFCFIYPDCGVFLPFINWSSKTQLRQKKKKEFQIHFPFPSLLILLTLRWSSQWKT